MKKNRKKLLLPSNITSLLKEGQGVQEQIMSVIEKFNLKEELVGIPQIIIDKNKMSEFKNEFEWAIYNSIESILINTQSEFERYPSDIQQALSSIINSVLLLESNLNDRKIKSLIIDSLAKDNTYTKALSFVESFLLSGKEIKEASKRVVRDGIDIEPGYERTKEIINLMRTRRNTSKPEIYICTYFIFPIIKKYIKSEKARFKLLRHSLLFLIGEFQTLKWLPKVEDLSPLYPSDLTRIVKTLKL